MRRAGFPERFSERQTASARGTAPYVVTLACASKVEAIKAVRACGARVISPLPPNALLVETSIFALGKMSVDAHFAAAREWLPEDKLDERLKGDSASGSGEVEVTVVALSPADVEAVVRRAEAQGGTRVTGCLNGKSSVTLRLPRKALAELAQGADVRWIEPFSRPKPLNDVAVGPTAMNVETVWNTLGLTGLGQVISTSDTGLDTGHLGTIHEDLRNRICGILATEGCTTEDTYGHGTHTAGSIVGDGTKSGGKIRGVAHEARLWVWTCVNVSETVEPSLHFPSYEELFRPDETNEIAFIHSASWGDSMVQGTYDTMCHDIDEYIWNHPDFLFVVANGNGAVGSPASAKNVLAVGATQNARTGHGAKNAANGNPTTVWDKSAHGPCADGRIKPDVCAPGVGILSTASSLETSSIDRDTTYPDYAYKTGTSMSTPLVAGAAALVRQMLVERCGFTNEPPTAALMKAILTGGAAGEIFPANDCGWGRVDLGETLAPSNRTVRFYDRIAFSNESVSEFHVTLTNAAPFDAQLVWIDYPAAAEASKALINDLDLIVSNRTTGAVFCGNGAMDGDHTNTVECVRLPEAAAGDYTIIVRGTDVAYDSSQGGAAALYLRGAIGERPEPVSPATLGIAAASPATPEVALRVGEGMEFSVTAETTDVEAPLVYTWLLDGAQVAQPSTNRFDYVPTGTHHGTRELKVLVSPEGMPNLVATNAWKVTVSGTLWVAASGRDEGATGEAERPFATIQAALAVAVTGDVVRVGAGRYVGGISASAGLARIESVEGPTATLIDGEGKYRCYDGSGNLSAVLAGFTLTNGCIEAGAGAGAYKGVLTNCIIRDCHAKGVGGQGGGAVLATLVDCRVENCSASGYAGGLYRCGASFCLIVGNVSTNGTDQKRGGVSRSVLSHCTVYGNVAGGAAGVDERCACTNCIVWGNTNENWYQYSNKTTSFANSCTEPEGFVDLGGNVVGNPLFVNPESGDFRLAAGSPCLGTALGGGNMGAWQGEGVVLDVYADAERGDDANDGFAANRAKKTIGAAVAAAHGGATVRVAAGRYRETVASGAREITILAVDGPDKTVIDGEKTRRCYCGDTNRETRVVGFTLENGCVTNDSGGGACYGVLSNCVIRNCSASLHGGGAYHADLYNCVVVGCAAEGGQGGGGYETRFCNCTVRGNRATNRAIDGLTVGGGVECYCFCENTLIWDNQGPTGEIDNVEYIPAVSNKPEYVTHLDHCCTTLVVPRGRCVITNDPQFVSSVMTNVCLYETSPCIAAGLGGVNIGAYLGDGVERLIPKLAADADGGAVTNAIASIGFADADVAAGVTNVSVYQEFSAWATNGLKRAHVINSPRAFDSFRVRDLVAEPTLLEGEKTSIELSAPVPDSDGTCQVTVSMTDGDSPIRLKAAKEAFAARLKVGSDLDALAPPSSDSISAEPASDGTSVTLTVEPPSPDRCFMRLVVP